MTALFQFLRFVPAFLLVTLAAVFFALFVALVWMAEWVSGRDLGKALIG